MVKVLFYVRVLRNHNIVIFVFLSFFFFLYCNLHCLAFLFVNN